MNKRERIQTVLLSGVFIFYILLLIKILFLSRISLSELFNSRRIIFGSINLIPFYSITEYITTNSINIKRFAFSNVVGNIAIFIPLGVYLSLFKKDIRVIIRLLFIFTVSLFVEFIQGLLGIGISDIDDVILNFLGGWLGILGYKFILFILQNEKIVHTTITIISAILGLPVILYLLFMFRMKF